MSWWSQVRHVFTRDLRRTWMSLGIFIATLCVAVARAVEWPPLMRDATVGVGILVVMCAAVVVARAVLADEPMRADAFWAIQPLHASAVATSKLVYVLLLLMLCALAVLVTRSAWNLPPLEIEMASIGLFPVLTLILLGVAIVAAVCIDFTRACVAVVAAIGIASLSDMREWEMTPGRYWALATLLSVGCTVLFVQRYRDRRSPILARGVTLGSGMVVMLFPAFVNRVAPVAPVVPVAPVTAVVGGGRSGNHDEVALSLPVVAMPACDRGRLIVPLAVVAPPGWRVGLMKPSLDVTLSNGATVPLSAPGWMQLAGTQGPMLPTMRDRAGVRVLGGDGEQIEQQIQIAFVVPGADAEHICGHIARLAMRLWVTTTTGTEVLRVPLSGAARADAPGFRARIAAATLQDADVAMTVRMSMLADDQAAKRDDLGALDFALLNQSQGEIVRLSSPRSDDGSSVSELPGLRHTARTISLEPYGLNRTRLRRLQSWRDSAVLIVTAPVERGRGWRQVEAVVTR